MDKKTEVKPENTGALVTLIAGLVLFLLGFVVAFGPIWIARMNTKPGHNWMSEGDPSSAGTSMWLLIQTVPIGGIIGLIGLVLSILGFFNFKPAPPESQDPDSL